MNFTVSIEKFIFQEGNTLTCLSKLQETGEEFEMKRFYLTHPIYVTTAAVELNIFIKLSWDRTRPIFINPLLISYYVSGSLCLLKPPSSGVSLRDVIMVHFPLKREVALFYIAEVALGLEYLLTKQLGLIHLPAEKIRLSRDGHILISDMDPSYVINTTNCQTPPALFTCLALLALSFEVDGFQFNDHLLSGYLAQPRRFTDDVVLNDFVFWARLAGVSLEVLRARPYLFGVPFEDIAMQRLPPPLDLREIVFASTEYFFNVKSRDELLIDTICGPHQPLFEWTESCFYYGSHPEGTVRKVFTMKPALETQPDGSTKMKTLETRDAYLHSDPLSACVIMTPFFLRDHLQPNGENAGDQPYPSAQNPTYQS